jgi:hypothetical protein
MEESLKWATEALHAADERRAPESWRKVFGPSFPLAEETSKRVGLLSAAIKLSGLSFPDRPIMPLQKPQGLA